MVAIILSVCIILAQARDALLTSPDSDHIPLYGVLCSGYRDLGLMVWAFRAK